MEDESVLISPQDGDSLHHICCILVQQHTDFLLVVSRLPKIHCSCARRAASCSAREERHTQLKDTSESWNTSMIMKLLRSGSILCQTFNTPYLLRFKTDVGNQEHLTSDILLLTSNFSIKSGNSEICNILGSERTI